MDIGYGNGYLLKCIYYKTKSDLFGIDISGDIFKELNKSAVCKALMLEKELDNFKFVDLIGVEV